MPLHETGLSGLGRRPSDSLIAIAIARERVLRHRTHAKGDVLAGGGD